MKTSLFMTLLLICYGLSAQNFTEVPSVLANINLRDPSAEFADINGDGMQDLLVMGRIVSTTYTTKLFVNVGNANFFEIQNTPFAPVGNGDLAFADVNGDGSQDLLLSGQFNVWYDSTKLYLNDGTGNFSEVLNTPFANVEFSAVAFADVNGDGSQDLFITGSGGTTQSSNTRNARLYLNDGAGNFTEVFNTPFVP
ncbi:MAG: VCBS repeat-containing protein, partial [Bacteroidota bacterium]